MDVDTAERIGDARPAMLSVGVQTWGTDVTALERYWKAADDLGYARITYDDGLADSTHDGWTMLDALAVLTRRARIGPPVTYAFSHPAGPPLLRRRVGREKSDRPLHRLVPVEVKYRRGAAGFLWRPIDPTAG